MENRPFIKVFFPLLSATVFIFGFSHAGSFALSKFTEAGTLGQSAMVASVAVGGQSEQEAAEALSQAVAEWRAEAVMKAEFSGEEMTLDLSVFEIDINRSIQQAGEGGSVPLAVSLNKDKLMEQLVSAFPDMAVDEMDAASFQADLISQASMLPSNSILSLSDYFTEGTVEEVTAEALTGEISVTPSVKRFIEAFPQITIKEGTEFSFLRHLEENGFMTDAKGEDLSVIASLLYKLVLQSNFSIIERNTSSELPEDIELGYEAKIDSGNNQDFVFANPNKTDFVIQLELLDNQLYGKLVGFPFAADYKVTLKDKEEFPPKKIVQYNPFLNENVVRVSEEGQKGVLIKVYRQSIAENGEVLQDELIAEDFYPPVHRIEIHSLEAAPEGSDPEIVDLPADGSNDSQGSEGPPPNSGSDEGQDEQEENTGSKDSNDDNDAGDEKDQKKTSHNNSAQAKSAK
ncbi:VanW family protein [Bacillus sp. AK031]